MNKTVKRTIIAVILLCVALAFACFAACGGNTPDVPDNPPQQGQTGTGENNGEQSGAEVVLSGTDIKTQNLTVDGTNLSYTVSNATATYSMINEITIADGASWKLYSDISCSTDTEVVSKTVALNEGDNIVYILVTNGNDIKLYTLSIYRIASLTVTFETNGGSLVDSQKVEENSCACVPTQVPTKTGYTFDKWDYDFNNPITKNTTINAKWIAVSYNISYDLCGGINASKNPSTYTIEQKITLSDNPTRLGYSFMGWSDNGIIEKGNTGDKTFTANWSADVKLTTDGKTVTGLNNDVRDLVILSEYNGVTVTKIKDSAFNDCGSLTSITIPDSVTSLSSGLLKGCSGLEEITIPFIGAKEGKTSSDTYQYPLGYIFGESSYNGGTKTQQYYYGSSTSSNTYDYYYIPSCLNKVTVTGGNILYGAFYNCSGLTTVTIGDSVTSIGRYAFYNCSSLKSVTIGSSVTSIGEYAFNGCSSLENIYYKGDINVWVQKEGLSKLMLSGKSSKKLYINGELLTEANITTATKINAYAFYCCSSLTSVTIGNSVTSIGDFAFSGCSSLTSVTFENPNGWYVSYSSIATSGTNLTLTDTAKNATYLTDMYCPYYWFCNE